MPRTASAKGIGMVAASVTGRRSGAVVVEESIHLVDLRAGPGQVPARCSGLLASLAERGFVAMVRTGDPR
jgi:hypothetical protein